MAAAKRKQDEKHLKMLRDMAALPHNKQCFDCHQRGPTYVNMTIGSFVCTSCSGILRGINPPHRVKSISMASFTQDEIDFIKCHGNEFCRKVWLGLYDSRTGMAEPDSREEQKVRDFMIQKYERKRWYVAPTDTMKEEARRINEAATNKQPTTRPLKSLLGENAAKLVVKEEQSPQQTPKNPPPISSSAVQQQTTQEQKTFPSPGQHSQSSQSSASTTMDLLGDLGGDPFASSAPGPPPAVGVAVGAGSGGDFADFSNFNQFSAQAPPQQPFQAFPTSSNPLVPLGNTPSSQPQVANGGFAGMNSSPAPPVSSAPVQLGGDKYSALSDLFSNPPATTQAESTSFSWNGGSSGTGGTGVNWAGGSNTSSNSTGIDWNSTGNTSSSGAGVNWNSSGSTNTSSNAGINWNNAPTTQSAANSGFSTSGTSLFGGSNAVSSQSTPGGVSGSNPFGGTSSNASLFGNQPSTGGFGQQPSQGGFGQPVAASGFGQPVSQSGGFGQPAAQLGGFGQPASQPAGFGQPASQPTGFGQPASQLGGFGAPQSGGFGQPASQPAGFGQPASQPAGFGQPASQPAGFGQPASQPAGFGQPASSGAGGFNAAFGGNTGGLGGVPPGGVGSSPAGSQFGQMQNGNSGFNTMGPVSSAGGFGGFSQTQTMPNFGNQMTAPAGQFGNKMGASGGAQMQGFPGGWGSTPAQAPTANPFMSAASQPVAPKSGSTNPFL